MNSCIIFYCFIFFEVDNKYNFFSNVFWADLDLFTAPSSLRFPLSRVVFGGKMVGDWMEKIWWVHLRIFWEIWPAEWSPTTEIWSFGLSGSRIIENLRRSELLGLPKIPSSSQWNKCGFPEVSIEPPKISSFSTPPDKSNKICWA